MIRSWYKESIYYRLYNILVVPYKKLLKKEGEGRAGSRIISSGWLRKKQKMSAIYFKALLQNGCDNWHPCQNALWAKRSSKTAIFWLLVYSFSEFLVQKQHWLWSCCTQILEILCKKSLWWKLAIFVVSFCQQQNDDGR